MTFHGSHHTAPPLQLDLPVGWHVVSFIDPAGNGGDLAFTEGLSQLDLPEILLWARPTEGLDPGADWLLTHRERGQLLNRWALDLVAGDLKPGQEREERFDGGHSVARFRFPPAVFNSPHQHPYLPSGSRVIRTAWSLLRRAPVRPPTTISATAVRRMERWIAATEAATLDRSLSPDDFELTNKSNLLAMKDFSGSHDGRDGFGTSNRFGPMTRWIEARIAQIGTAGTDVLAAFCDRLFLAGEARCEDCLMDDLARLATRSQRNRACREASRLAQELGVTVAGSPGPDNPLWRRAVALLEGFQPQPEVLAEPALRAVLSDGFEVLLVSAVLADIATPALTASATGPWEWAVAGRRLPGRLWLARPAVRQAARELLAPATPAVLATAVEHARQQAEGPAGSDVNRLVTGLQTTAAASARPGALLRRDQSRGLPPPVIRAADQLAGQLLTAMAVPQQFPQESWDSLVYSLRALAPALPLDLRTEIPCRTEPQSRGKYRPTSSPCSKTSAAEPTINGSGG